MLSRQFSLTLTYVVKKTFLPKNFSISLRAKVPTSLSIEPPLPIIIFLILEFTMLEYLSFVKRQQRKPQASFFPFPVSSLCTGCALNFCVDIIPLPWKHADFHSQTNYEKNRNKQSDDRQ